MKFCVGGNSISNFFKIQVLRNIFRYSFLNALLFYNLYVLLFRFLSIFIQNVSNKVKVTRKF